MKALFAGLAVCLGASIWASHTTPPDFDASDYSPPQDPKVIKTATFAVG